MNQMSQGLAVRPGRGGFTLIELLIVVAIIAILAAIAVPNFLEAQVRAKVSRVRADMRSLATAIESYRVDDNHYPIVSQVANPPTDKSYLLRYHGFLKTELANQENNCRSLTTPIQYITSYPSDPFSTPDGYTDISNNLSELAAGHSYWYVNVEGAALDPNVATVHGGDYANFQPNGAIESPAALQFNGDGGPRVSAPWILFSAGPDRLVRTPASGAFQQREPQLFLYNAGEWNFANGYIPGQHPMIYDPSNGTVSEGDLWTFGGGGQIN